MEPSIIIKKRFTPRVGEGRNLMVALKRMSDALEASGFPPMELWSPTHGSHNQVVTIERYADMAAWDAYNGSATKYPSLVSGVFDGIYPATGGGYDTEILRIIDKGGIK